MTQQLGGARPPSKEGRRLGQAGGLQEGVQGEGLGGTMARPKVGRYGCGGLALSCALAACVCVAVVLERKCPAGAFPRAAVAADSATCSRIGR